VPTPRSPRLALVFLACLVALAWFQRPVQNPNENSRLTPVLAAFWHQTLTIDGYAALPPTWTTDRSALHGHWYSDKAPGSSFLAAIGYAPVYAWERLTGREASYLTRKQAMTIAADGIPVAAALTALFALLAAAWGARRAAAVTAAGLLATPLLPYGSTLFGHALAGALLFLAFALLRGATERTSPTRPTRWRDLAGAGALLGLTAATEFPAAPAGLLVVAYGLWRLGRRGELGRARTWLGPLLGAAPFLVGLGVWNRICFGSPFAIGYEHLDIPFFRELHAQGFMGVRLPRLANLYYLTVHPARGIFVSAPILLLAFPGLWAMARRGWRAEAALCLGVFLSFLLLNAGLALWWGGWTYTARHLVPAVFFLLFPLGFLDRRWLWAAVPLALLSAAQTLAAAAGDPFTHDGFLYPAVLEAQRRGRLLPYGAWPFTKQLLPSLAVHVPGGPWLGFAPSWGRLLRLSGPGSVAAMLAVVAALLAAAARTARTGGERRPIRARRPLALGDEEARQGA
jgi:hypothetical protein